MDISAAKKAKQYAYFAGSPGADPLGELIFVDTTNGNDSNDGHDPRRAKSTVAGAKAVAEAGDTIIVSDGAGNAYALRVMSGSVYAALGPDLPPMNYLGVTADFTTSTWASAAAHEILAVSGMNRIIIIPEVVGSVGDADDSGTIILGTADDTDAFIGATTCTQLDAGDIWLSTTGASNISNLAKGSVIDQIVIDADIGYTIANTATTAGSIKFHCWWLPLEDAASVTAGAGGTL